MHVNRKNRNLRSSRFLVDVLHILICILIVALAALAFSNPAEHTIVYPIIFFLAAILNAVEAAGKLKRDNKRKNQLAAGISFLLAAAFLLALAVISAVSVLRQTGR